MIGLSKLLDGLLGDWLAAITRSVRAPRRLRRLTVLPWLECLEDRCTPVKWTGNGPDSLWSDAKNWAGNQRPGIDPNVPAIAEFDGNGNTAVTADEATPNSGGLLRLDQISISSGFTKTITLNVPLWVRTNGADSTIAGGILAGNQTFTFVADPNNPKSLNLSGGTIHPNKTEFGVDPIGPYCVVNVTGNVTLGGTVNVGSGSTLNVNGGNVTVDGGTTIDNVGTLDFQTDNNITSTQAATLKNEGTLQKSAGTGQLIIGLAFTNTRNLKVKTGQIDFTSTAKQTDGTTTIFNLAELATTTTYVVNFGVFQNAGSATVRGNLEVTGGDVYPGNDGQVGTLVVTNNYTQTGGTLHIDNDVNGGKNDQLSVGNTVKLSGKLAVNTLNAPPPVKNPPVVYNIISYNLLQGDFSNAGLLDVPGSNPAVVYKTLPRGAAGTYQLQALAKPKPGMGFLTPNTGSITGGTAVALFGQGFTGATAVSFGGVAATSFTVLSDTEILAYSPAHSAGQVDVTVTTSAGTSDTTSADRFTYTGTLSNTTTSVSSSAGSTTYGQSLTLTANVAPGGSGTPTGTVTFYDGSTVLGTATLNAGIATLTLTTLGPGAHLITAVYNGDANFAGSAASPLTQTVTSADTTTTLTSSQNPAPAGTPVTFTATVSSSTSGTPTGTVQFWEIDPNTGLAIALLGTGTLNASGQATLTLSTLPSGSHLIQALYLDDGNYNSSFGRLTQVIS
jgi:hypothetical protein